MSTVLAIVLLLESPNVSSPLNCDAAHLLRNEDMTAYRSLVSFPCAHTLSGHHDHA
jgi:peroxin-4